MIYLESEIGPQRNYAMTGHQLAKLLLELPDLPVATHANNTTWFGKVNREALKIGILETYAGPHICIGNISKKNINGTNWHISEMLVGSAPEEWHEERWSSK